MTFRIQHQQVDEVMPHQARQSIAYHDARRRTANNFTTNARQPCSHCVDVRRGKQWIAEPDAASLHQLAGAVFGTSL